MVYRETFLQIHKLPLQLLILKNWTLRGRQPLRSRVHMSTVEKSERPEQNQDLRCQSRPSAKDSVIPSGGDSSKNYGADKQQLQISDLHFDKFLTPATFACWKIRFQDRGMYLFAISYGSNAMDQRSGVGWFSGWIEIFVIYSWYFNAEFWSTWCENCFGTETKSSIIHI